MASAHLLFEQKSHTEIEQFVADHTDFAIDPEQPDYRGGTNYVLLGRLKEQAVVFKYFVTKNRWRNEYSCLRHYAVTGYVPRIIATLPDQLIVMTRLAGDNDLASLTEHQRQQISHEMGEALAAFAQTPLPKLDTSYSPIRDFEAIPWHQTLSTAVQGYLAIGHRAQQSVSAYQTLFFSEALALIEAQSRVVDRQPHLLFHEDISNFTVHNGKFIGFYDLEMCRLGTVAMQFGVALNLRHSHHLNWPRMIAGHEAQTGRRFGEKDFVAILAMNHLYHLIRICRWGNWDGTAAQPIEMQASADEADWFLERMRDACYQLQNSVDLSTWFPSLG